MKVRNSDELIKEINEQFSKDVTSDAKFTIYTIRNLIESNARVEESVDELHLSITNANKQNDILQRRIFYLTIVGVSLAIIQVFAVLVELSKNLK